MQIMWFLCKKEAYREELPITKVCKLFHCSSYVCFPVIILVASLGCSDSMGELRGILSLLGYITYQIFTFFLFPLLFPPTPRI